MAGEAGEKGRELEMVGRYSGKTSGGKTWSGNFGIREYGNLGILGIWESRQSGIWESREADLGVRISGSGSREADLGGDLREDAKHEQNKYIIEHTNTTHIAWGGGWGVRRNHEIEKHMRSHGNSITPGSES